MTSLAMPESAAYRINGQRVKAENFYAVACDPRRSVVVEACAGAGKTWILVSRILRALLEGAEPQDILAITFTRKAAAEMRERLSDWLQQFSAISSSHAERVLQLKLRGLPSDQAEKLAPKLAGLQQQLLQQSQSVTVRTFHAWFSVLLKAAPLSVLRELGLNPAVKLIEDPEEHAPAVFRAFYQALSQEPALLGLYESQLYKRGRHSLTRWLHNALDKRTEFELADRFGVLDGCFASNPQDEPPLLQIIQPQLDLKLVQLARNLGQQKNKTCIDKAIQLERALGLPDPMQRWQSVLSALFTKEGQRPVRLQAPELEAVWDILEQLRSQQHEYEARLEHTRMVQLARLLFREYSAYKLSQGLADMADLESAALRILSDPDLSHAVLQRLDAKVRYVLIDEFQDTSPLQWHALYGWLGAYAGAGGGNTGHQPPAVFIVGDPKQSIYRFRRAEPKVFAAARQFVMEGLGGDILECDHSRRNTRSVIQVINQVFGQFQENSQFKGFRSHSTEVADHLNELTGVFYLPYIKREKSPDASTNVTSLWRNSLSTPREDEEDTLLHQECRQVAHAVAELCNQGLPARHIQVLSRKRKALRFLAAELQVAAIPYAAPEALRLMDAIEVGDLVALLEALVSPQRHLALAQALRSPIFRATDQDLIQLATLSKQTGHAWWDLLTLSDGNLSNLLITAGHKLKSWQEVLTLLPLHDALDRILWCGNVLENFVAAVPSSRRNYALQSLQNLIGLTLTLDAARYTTPFLFVKALKRRALLTPPAVQSDAVQLLTIHGAKGLEAEVVFVMDTHPSAKITSEPTLLIDWPVYEQAPITCAFIYQENRPAPSLKSLMEQEKAEREREEFNSLYVAMTRARRLLIFSANEPATAKSATAWWPHVQQYALPWPKFDLVQQDVMYHDQAYIAYRVLPTVTFTAPHTLSASEAISGNLSQVGQAIHRALEWITYHPDDHSHWETVVSAAASQYGVSYQPVIDAVRRILTNPAASDFLNSPHMIWSGNEVPIYVDDQIRRIDRLVLLQRETYREWWIIDYKLHPAPQQNKSYQTQLKSYVKALQQLQPGDKVCAAFISATGEIFEQDKFPVI
jgi:ATP-dependent helicase/nuclease subunit A